MTFHSIFIFSIFFKIVFIFLCMTVRTLMRFDTEPIKEYDLSSLRVLGSVGASSIPCPSTQERAFQLFELTNYICRYWCAMAWIGGLCVCVCVCVYRRADQPRSLEVVQRERGSRALHHRGHVLADRDGRASRHQLARWTTIVANQCVLGCVCVCVRPSISATCNISTCPSPIEAGVEKSPYIIHAAFISRDVLISCYSCS